MTMAINREDYIFDYRLGYVRAGCALNGFDVLGDEGAPRILTLGGYTAPAQARSKQSWPNFLYEALKARGKRAQIINGDTEGFTSAQEMLMLIRDGILLKPEIVICLSGFYNFAYKTGFLRANQREFAEILSKHPFTNPGQLEFYKDITSRFGLGKDKMYYGDENNMPALDYWLLHTDIIHCLCEEFGLKHITFLQPCVFSGGYTPGQDETAALADAYGMAADELKKYGSEIRRVYDKASEILSDKTRGYVIDLSGLYSGMNGIYADACHTNAGHTGMLAEAVCEAVIPYL